MTLSTRHVHLINDKLLSYQQDTFIKSIKNYLIIKTRLSNRHDSSSYQNDKQDCSNNHQVNMTRSFIQQDTLI